MLLSHRGVLHTNFAILRRRERGRNGLALSSLPVASCPNTHVGTQKVHLAYYSGPIHVPGRSLMVAPPPSTGTSSSPSCATTAMARSTTPSAQMAKALPILDCLSKALAMPSRVLLPSNEMEKLSWQGRTL